MAQDAIALLEADHHRVEELFRDFKSAGDPEARLHLAQVICMELTLHAMVEEEIFYPAFARATGDEQMLEHALKEHQEIKDLIAGVLTAENLDGAIEAVKRHTLHHVEEERRGMGGRIQTRRAEVAEAIQDA